MSADEFLRRRDIAVRISGKLVYVDSHAPNSFPEEDQTSLDKEMSRLMELWAELEKRTQSSERRAELLLPREEAHQAWDAYRAGDEERGSRLLQSADWHFKDFMSGNMAKHTFIAGENGLEKKEK